MKKTGPIINSKTTTTEPKHKNIYSEQNSCRILHYARRGVTERVERHQARWGLPVWRLLLAGLPYWLPWGPVVNMRERGHVLRDNYERTLNGQGKRNIQTLNDFPLGMVNVANVASADAFGSFTLIGNAWTARSILARFMSLMRSNSSPGGRERLGRPHSGWPNGQAPVQKEDLSSEQSYARTYQSFTTVLQF